MSVMHEQRDCVIVEEAGRVLGSDERYVRGSSHFRSETHEALENIAKYVIRASFILGAKAPT